MSCVFCAIGAGTEPASFVYEDEDVFGILSLDQPTRCKVLVVPRIHVGTIFDLSEELAGRLFRASARIARAVHEASGCSGLNVVQSNGAAAGQDVSHLHIHLIPRAEGDDIRLEWPARHIGRDGLDVMAADVRRSMETARGE